MGFEIAGSNGKFVAAQAKIKGKDVIVSSQEVRSPKYVRYAWFNDPKQLANLGNKAGLPASPFTTQKDLLK